MKKLLLLSAITLLSLVLLVVFLVCLLIGTQTGRLFVADKVLSLAQSETLSIDIMQLKTPKLGVWQIGQLQIKKQNKVWIEVQSAELNWRVRSLFSANIDIQKLAAQSIFFDASITAPPKTEKPEQDKASFEGLPKLPSITIEKLRIAKVDIEGLKLPNKKKLPDYLISGSAQLFDEHPILLDLAIVSLANKQNRFDIQSTVLDERSVSLRGKLYDAPTGLIHSLLKLPLDQALDAELDFELHQADDHFEVGVNRFTLPLGASQLQNRGTVQIYDSTSSANGLFSIKLPAWELQTDKRSHQLKGEYTTEDLWATVDLNRFPLTLAKPWVPALTSGTLDLEADIKWVHGRQAQENKSALPNKNLPKVTGTMDLSTVYKDQTVQAKGKINFDYPVLKLEKTTASVADMEASANGTLDFEQARNALTLQVKRLDTQPLRELGLPIPNYLNAQASLVDAQVTGSLKNPNIGLKTQAKGLIYDTDFVLDARLDATPRSADIHKLELFAHEATLSVDGKIDWTGDKNTFTARYDNLNERFITLAQQFATFDFPNDFRFSASGNSTLDGSLKQPEILTDTLVRGTYDHDSERLPFLLNTIGSVNLKRQQALQADIDKLTLQLFDKPTLTASGHFHEKDMNLKVALNRLPTQTLTLLGLPDIRGQAHADLALTGSLEQPNLNGTLQYKEAVKVGKQTVQLNWRADLNTSEARQLTVASTLTENQNATGTMSVQLPLDTYLSAYLKPVQAGQAKPLVARIQGTQDLRILRWFLDPLTHPIGGLLEADLTLSGTLSDPKAQGQLAMKDAHYAHTTAGVQLDQISLLLALEGKNVNIKNARARTGGEGELTLSGRLFLAEDALLQPNPIRLSLRAQNATVVERPGLQAQLSGETTIEGNLEDVYIKGDLDFTPLTINIDQLSQSSVPEIKVTERGDARDEKVNKTMGPIVHLDLNVAAEQQAFIRGRGLDAELGGNIRVTGTLSDIQYIGRFKTRRGKMDLLTRRFILQDGDVRFSNEAIVMRIPAVYTDDNIEIRMELFGTPDDPKLKLSSVPDLPQDEILARLIFGESITEVTPFQAIRLAAAARTLSQGSGFDPLDTTRDKLGLDSISVENETLESGETGVAVGVGKYINERVYLELERSPNPSQPWNASVEIELNHNVTLESTAGTRGKVNTKVLWTRDY